MKLVSFLKNGNEYVGLISEDKVFDINYTACRVS